jgi:hypothetical protein
MDRLDDVGGPRNWRGEFATGPNGGTICGISILINGEWVQKWDGADNTDFEGIKGGLSDSFKRAGVKWGIGRYLYRLDTPWVACEQRGKSVVLKEKPVLPQWALPDGVTMKATRKAEDPYGKPAGQTTKAMIEWVKQHTQDDDEAAKQRIGLVLGQLGLAAFDKSRWDDIVAALKKQFA